MQEKIVLLDEMGNKVELQLVMTFGLDDSNYAALIPMDDLKKEIFLRFELDENGGTILVPLDNDQEYKDVKEAYEEIRKERLQWIHGLTSVANISMLVLRTISRWKYGYKCKRC